MRLHLSAQLLESLFLEPLTPPRILTQEDIAVRAPAALADRPDPRVSSRYAFISTAEAMGVLREMGWHPVEARQSRVRLEENRQSAWHEIEFRRPGDAPVREVGDVVAQLTIINNHCGVGTYQLHGGLMRLVCKNGLMFPRTGFAGIRFRHTREGVNRMRKGVEEWAGFLPKLIGVARRWQEIELRSDQEQELAVAALRLRYGPEEKKWPATPEAVALAVRRPEDASNDLWSTFNRIQENVTKGGPEVPGKIDAKGRRRKIRTLFHPRLRLRLSHGLWMEAARLGGGLDFQAGLLA